VGGTLLRAPQLATHRPLFPPWYVAAMRPRPRAHAVRDSPTYVDCGARATQGCCLPTCARSSPGCVGGDSAPGAPASHTTIHVPTVLCACHASPAPPARFPPLSYVCRLRGEGRAWVLPPNMCPLPVCVCGWGLCPAPASHTPAHVPAVLCACDASPAPPARFPPLYYVYRLRCEGGIGVLPISMCPLQPWVRACVGTLPWASQLATRPPCSHRGVCL
jgi:hypothetical protein